MKELLQSKIKGYSKRIFFGILTLLIGGTLDVSAQVSFTQTLNADFYKGAYNDLLVGSDNVYLPYQATDVNNWLTTTVLPQTLEGHKAATWNNRYVYVVGGYNDVTYSSSVYRATLQSGGISSWTALNSLPLGLRDHAVVIGTNTIYVSPVPFEELNKTIEKGKGKPHLQPVEDTMAQANNLAAAMIVAPIAGIAAAVGKYYKRTR